jgi:NADP-dependent 3-hydroxy acid dehydrogenase YdfG
MLGGPYGHAAKPDSPRYSHKERIMITDKVVAITGASSGIGEATALLLAARGAKVVLGARRVDRLEELVARITKNGGEAMAVPTDVVKRGDLENLVKATLARFGRLDVLVNNAGIAPISPIDELRVDDWDNMIDVNIKGVLYGIAAALPVFRKQAFGHFVTVASVSGLKIKRFTPALRMLFALSAKACVRKPVKICVLRRSRPVSRAPSSPPP